MTDAERLIILRNAINSNDVTVDHDGVHCVHDDCDVCTACAYCDSFESPSYHIWHQASTAFLERVKYRIPSAKVLCTRYPEHFV